MIPIKILVRSGPFLRFLLRTAERPTELPRALAELHAAVLRASALRPALLREDVWPAAETLRRLPVPALRLILSVFPVLLEELLL